MNEVTHLLLNKNQQQWEPLSPAADYGHAESIEDIEKHWALCDGYKVLRNQIYQYCCGAMRGESFLVAGHRGSGKTLLTHLAIQINQWRIIDGLPDSKPVSDGAQANSAKDQSQPAPLQPRAYPFPVHIHGPDLLVPPKLDSSDPEQELVKHAVEQILLALKWSLAREIGDLFARAFAEKPPRALLADVARELTGFPTGSGLTKYWEQLDLLETGILGRFVQQQRQKQKRHAVPTVGLGPLGQTENGMQGRCEILLLEALNHCAHTLRAEQLPPDLQLTQSTLYGIPVSTRRLHKAWPHIVPILSILIAGIAAVATSTGDTPLFRWIVPAVVFLAIFLLVRAVLNRNERDFPAESLVEGGGMPELRRALPHLVNEIRAAGFAPVFVVDDLDKLDNAEDRLQVLLEHFTYLSAHSAFFCFLTERHYFETIAADIRQNRYPTLKSYFSNKVLIHYDPEQLSQYARRRFGL